MNFFGLKLFLISSFLLCKMQVSAQNNEINSFLLQSKFALPTNGLQPKRVYINSNKNKTVVKIIAGAPIYFYQNILSEQIQASCTYEISCSEYLKLCIEKYGFIKGTMAGLNQFSKCNTNNFKNHMPIHVDENYKIINNVADEKM